MENEILNYGPWPYIVLGLIVAAIGVVIYMRSGKIKKKVTKITDDFNDKR